MLPVNLIFLTLVSFLRIDTPTVKNGMITYKITTVGEAYSNADSLTLLFNEDVKSMNLYLKGGVEIKTIRRYSTTGNKFEFYFLRNDLYEKIIDVEDWHNLDVGWPDVERLSEPHTMLGYTCDNFLIRSGNDIMLEIMAVADIEPAQKLHTGFDGIPLIVKVFSEKGYILYEANRVSFEAGKDFDLGVKSYKETSWEVFMEKNGTMDHFYKVFGFFVP